MATGPLKTSSVLEPVQRDANPVPPGPLADDIPTAPSGPGRKGMFYLTTHYAG